MSIPTTLALSLAITCTGLLAGFGPEPPIARIGENPQEIVIPIYPKELAGKNISAECYVHIDIDEDGKITDCSIDDPKLPKPFADSVLSAVKQWRFVPQQFLEKSSGKITTSAAGYNYMIVFDGKSQSVTRIHIP
jgi:TonB family protein